MYTFGNVKVGGFFVVDGQRYRKVLHSKCWSHEHENIRYHNAVGVERKAPAMRLFDDDDQLEDIPWRADRLEPIPLETIFGEMEDIIEHLRTTYLDNGDAYWEADIETIEYIVTLARAEKWKEAYRKVRSLDTYVREGKVTREMYDEICERMESEE